MGLQTYLNHVEIPSAQKKVDVSPDEVPATARTRPFLGLHAPGRPGATDLAIRAQQAPPPAKEQGGRGEHGDVAAPIEKRGDGGCELGRHVEEEDDRRADEERDPRRPGQRFIRWPEVAISSSNGPEDGADRPEPLLRGLDGLQLAVAGQEHQDHHQDSEYLLERR
jgi:hypothetical protein